jgi:uncharacterized protein (DUF488 family)
LNGERIQNHFLKTFRTAIRQVPLNQNTLYTVGHSTRTIEEFLALLGHYRIQLLVDVRTIPMSRRLPHFNQTHLASALPERRIAYLHLPALGGLRKSTDPDSPNRGWRNMSFRGYADYMQTEAFEKGIDALLSEAGGRSAAVMCAEAVPWRCHRSLISDALLVRGVPVFHLLSLTQTREHLLTSFAKVEGRKIVYPPSGEQPRLF